MAFFSRAAQRDRGRTLRVYQKMSRFPLGKRLYSRMVGFYAPYTSTIGAHVEELRPGYCALIVKDRRKVRNHLRTVHAAALCNLCETTMGLLADVTIPPRLRWIPAEMDIQYLKKARGALRAEGSLGTEGPYPDKIPITVEVTDRGGDAVARAVITILATEYTAGAR
ncbi:MAG: DUF4442 domain-containing protein [Spirochaetes bacterium]|nr:DUF4442 domain-containing protein [Spirochaetota bacterium]